VSCCELLDQGGEPGVVCLPAPYADDFRFGVGMWKTTADVGPQQGSSLGGRHVSAAQPRKQFLERWPDRLADQRRGQRGSGWAGGRPVI